MKTQPGSTVVGVFKDRLQAINAINELYESGFGEEQVGLITRHAESATGDLTNEDDSQVATGALTGAVAGLGMGALTGWSYCISYRSTWSGLIPMSDSS
jgi:hypothetical protein